MTIKECEIGHPLTPTIEREGGIGICKILVKTEYVALCQ
jgi:hypothetical protein